MDNVELAMGNVNPLT